jgi:hypothetical protein
MRSIPSAAIEAHILATASLSMIDVSANRSLNTSKLNRLVLNVSIKASESCCDSSLNGASASVCDVLRSSIKSRE